MKFVKAQTNGNDFIIINGDFCDFKYDIKLLSDRNFGVGCDQLIFFKPLEQNRYFLEFFNQNGTAAKMCGNGTCAAAIYIKDVIGNQNSKFFFDISNIEYKATIQDDEATIFFKKPKIDYEIDKIKFVSTMNKHAIYAVEDISEVTDAFAIRLNSTYPECNIHFLQNKGDNIIQIRSFERGVGWTKACGSGAVASAFAFCCEGEHTVIQDGGISKINIKKTEILLTTSPKLVFEGTLIE